MIEAAVLLVALSAATAQTLPSEPLAIRDFTLQFDAAGTFSLTGLGWPPMAGTWKAGDGAVTLLLEKPPKGCSGAGTYNFSIEGQRVSFALVSDECTARRMI